MHVKHRLFLFAVLLGTAACGGGGTTVPSFPSGSTPATTAPVAGATATPVAGATAGPTAAASANATATPGSSIAAPTAPPDAAGHTNTVPAVPAGSACRAGTTYNVYVQSGPTDIAPGGSTEAFTVFEPDTLCGNKTYPLIFNGPGFGASRTSAAGSFEQFTGAGYGVISVDEAGEGEDGGKIRVMDPDQEGVMLLSVMNWAQTKLTWLAYGPTNDGADQHEPVFGSEGGSYGGMYQFMLLNVDKRHRLRAIVPQITPANLNFSLFPGGEIKTLWDTFLFGDGQTAGNGTTRAQFDPYVNNGFVADFQANAEDSGFQDFFGYHSADYFCNGTAIATNGGAGTAPQLPPTTAPPKINALIWIGARDTLFDFNNGYHNYQCMQRGGGDVRLLSYQYGHNSLQVVPDESVKLFYPAGDELDTRCGMLAEATAELDWFNQYLKGQQGAAAAIPANPCISLSDGDGIVVPRITTAATGGLTSYSVPATVIAAGGSPDLAPTAIKLGNVAGPGGDVVAGIPHVTLDISNSGGTTNTGTPAVYIGLGVVHASNPSTPDLMDNGVMPFRGTGHFDVDLVGGGIRLAAGDQLELLIYGNESQFAATGSVNTNSPALIPVSVTGTVSVPDLGSVAANI